jgi:hypothetical protein
MKTYLAIYLGTEAALARSGWNELTEAQREQRSASAIDAWMKWGAQHAAAIVDHGTPLGKTKRTDASGVKDVKNELTGYVIVRADSHDAAARMFEGHPHFTIFPGDSVEIMECLPLPGR